MNRSTNCNLFLLLAGLMAAPAFGQREFSVPLADLQAWSQKVIVSVEADITGHSAVHPVEKDCEMHFGAKVPAYKGDPPGFVLEPMNLCIEPFPGKRSQADRDWTKFGDSLNGATVTAEGVPRIWPEHLAHPNEKTSDSNPNHAVELHPLLTLTRGSKRSAFTKFVSAPDGLAGISEGTSENILKKTTVTATKTGEMVNVRFFSGTIGNFAVLHIRTVPSTSVEADGGHRMDGAVVFGRNDTVPVRLLTIAGTDIDTAIASRSKAFDALVLFSLSPEALLKAALRSSGEEIDVEQPLELIIYGDAEVQ